MDGVVPVGVVVGRTAVPAAILRLQGLVLPIVAGVLAADDRSLTGDAFGPHLGRVDEVDVPHDAVGHGARRGERWLGQTDALGGIRIDVSHLRPRRQRLHQIAVAAHPEHISHPVGAIGGAARVEQGAQRGLGARGDGGQRLVDGAAAIQFITQPRRDAKVGLRAEDDQELSRRAIGCGRQQGRVGLGRPGGRGSGPRRAEYEEGGQGE